MITTIETRPTSDVALQVRILGTGSVLPGRPRTTAEIAEALSVGRAAAWEARTGIKTRYWAEPGTLVAPLAAEALRRALDAAGLPATARRRDRRGGPRLRPTRRGGARLGLRQRRHASSGRPRRASDAHREAGVHPVPQEQPGDSRDRPVSDEQERVHGARSSRHTDGRSRLAAVPHVFRLALGHRAGGCCLPRTTMPGHGEWRGHS